MILQRGHSRRSEGRKSTSGVQGWSPVGGMGDKDPQKLTMFYELVLFRL